MDERHPMRYYVERDGVNYNTHKQRLAVARRMGLVGDTRKGYILQITEDEWQLVKICKTYKPRA